MLSIVNILSFYGRGREFREVEWTPAVTREP